MRPIRTAELTAADVPEVGNTWVRLENGEMHGPGDDWSLHSFALSFNGYEFLGSANDEYLRLTNTVASIYEKEPRILKCFSVTGLRCLLFIEQRKMKESYPGRLTPYVRDIVEAIRTRLSA